MRIMFFCGLSPLFGFFYLIFTTTLNRRRKPTPPKFIRWGCGVPTKHACIANAANRRQSISTNSGWGRILFCKNILLLVNVVLAHRFVIGSMPLILGKVVAIVNELTVLVPVSCHLSTCGDGITQGRSEPSPITSLFYMRHICHHETCRYEHPKDHERVSLMSSLESRTKILYLRNV